MNDEAIKKALVCCLIGECEGCPISKFSDCYETLKDEAMSLINRQQERIEELELITGLAKNRKYYKKFVDEIFCKQEGKELSEPDFDYIYQLYFEQQAEIEQLKSLCTSKDVIIKAQEAEIERLKWEKDHFEFKVDDLKGKLEKFKEYRDIKNGAYEREIEKQQAVIDDLKHEIRNLECEKGQLEGTIDFLVEQAKSEAIKEFAERLKIDWQENDFYWEDADVYKWIDNLVKEMVGEQDA